MFSRRPAARPTSPLVRRTLSLEPLESRQLLAADFHLLSDVNQTLTDLGSDIGEIVVIGETAYFTANDGVSGQELWKSDGTLEGTVRVKDIFPGDKGSNPTYLTEFQGVLYFAARDREVSTSISNVRDAELWRSDGTEAGTYRLKDIVAGDQGSSVRQLMNIGGTLFFSASAQSGGSSFLWKSDGTESGTERIVIPGGMMGGAIQPTSPEFIGSVGELLLFTEDADLWRSDGTGSGTFRLKDLSNLSYRENPRVLTSTGATTYFAANDGASGFGVWKTDGTVEGTVLVSNVKPKTLYPSLVSAASIGETIVFAASDPEHGEELWRTDGTAEGTVLLKDIRPGGYTSPWGSGPNSSAPFGFTNVNGVVYFAVSGPAGTDLWKTDGTTDGTVLVKAAIGYGSQPNAHLTNVGGKLYFSAAVGEPSELWTSDGTEAGTYRIKDIAEGGRGSYPRLLTEFNGGAIFTASDHAHGFELWKTDGTEAGTALIKDILPATADSTPSLVTNVAGAIFFTADNGAVGEELWTSGGDAASTQLVKDIRPGLESSLISNLTEVGGTLFFTADDGVSGVELWKSNGTAEGTTLVRDIVAGPGGASLQSLVNVNGTLYFSANDGVAGVELWMSDGTEAGTVRVKDIANGPASSSPGNLVNVGGVLYFSANDGVTGGELWRSDGSENGTVQVKDIFPGPSGSIASQLTNVGGVLYFSAWDSNSNGELWRSDGTEAGTLLVKDIVPGPNGSWPRGFANDNGELYFSTSKEHTDGGLWKSDGTEAGTVKLPKFSAYTSTLSLMAVGKIGATAFVVETSWSNGYPATLWRTDGTEAGTSILVYSAPLGNFTMWGDHLYFTKFDQTHGMELWRTDGTYAGTELVKDFTNDYRSSLSGADSLKVINDRLVAVATTNRYGAELWISEQPAPTQPGDYDSNSVVDGADFLAWQRGFGGMATPAGSGADGDGSGAVDTGDLSVWAEHFGEGSLGGGVATDAAVSAAMSVAVVERAEVEQFAPVSLAAAEGAVAVDEFFAKPRAAGSRSLIALAQGAFGIEDSRARSAAAQAIVRADDAAEIPHHRAKRASSRDAALASLADWPLASLFNLRIAGQLEQGDEFSKLGETLDSLLRSE